MLPRLLSLRAARFGRFPSGEGIRHLCASSSSPRQELVVSSGIRGTSHFPHPDSVLGRILKLEKKLARIRAENKGLIRTEVYTHNAQQRLDTNYQYMTRFVYGTGLLGIGTAIFKFYYYDDKQKNEMKTYIQDVIGNSESKTDQRMDQMDQRIGNLESKIERMESKIERMESKIERMESEIERMESKIDQRMGEIFSYLQAKKG